MPSERFASPESPPTGEKPGRQLPVIADNLLTTRLRQGRAQPKATIRKFS